MLYMYACALDLYPLGLRVPWNCKAATHTRKGALAIMAAYNSSLQQPSDVIKGLLTSTWMVFPRGSRYCVIKKSCSLRLFTVSYTIPYHTIPHHTTPHHTTPHHTTLYYIYFSILYFTILYHTILNYIILCYTILYYTILYYTILYYTILYYTILYYTILYYTILYYTILYYTMLCYAILYYTILYYTILYYTILYYPISAQKVGWRLGSYGRRHLPGLEVAPVCLGGSCVWAKGDRDRRPLQRGSSTV